ncbi:hypothetical protein COS81_03640 [candidate division WWE3 bacterium CG06_land_8_20_14_3_00_42_16]|uniref:Hydrolase TatD n=4 Tax=Katanobacteria TaxID=422282 RepID=A0A2M7AMS7_UNCKA|nr:MAG: hypothetical protein AUJ38_02055 [bacterium CG1_02_42_9]PIU68550.1 MAG: hypothetical protein COS81_03640 [candidate division WWE3 bacterium CG06_land_8_20_14_3_00_42_16]PIZ43071.1 MAG: hypothetical protein COY34_01600 [candidate division WWE3 bacterium CG_4_10_14_0_2_um_filter_42_8]PJA37147.1 MAG: hypothetical protein CO181_04670 [candidate division WWE3 bacterium CG_4_9_14_3_um_filter_43_9]PJC69487.1 MAG: hypothetical protein CO015_00065 [candidate division WWE3 bacterium CG_4_8_14_3_u
MSFLIDTHAHLNFPEFETDRNEVIARAFAGGIKVIINPSSSVATSRTAVKLAQAYPQIFAAVGVHPYEIDTFSASALEELILKPKVVALGECGLDFFRRKNREILEKQRVAFEKQLRLAEKYNLPVIVHSRNAFDLTLAILKEYDVRAVFHCWSYGLKEALTAIKSGYSISFTAIVTYPNADPIRQTAAAIPPDKFWLETDSPLLPPQSQRGQRNEPQNLWEIARQVADLRQVDLNILVEKTSVNAIRFFKLKDLKKW